MSFNDPIGDMITRIRNAQKAHHAVVNCPDSSLRRMVLDVLKSEGFIREYTVKEIRTNIKEIVVELKYQDGQPAIHELKRVSKPGRRVYSGIKALPKFYNGLGISILSTPRGVMADHEARKANVGGEVLCNVF
jgi:small subunit ribosomal protein S8